MKSFIQDLRRLVGVRIDRITVKRKIEQMSRLGTLKLNIGSGANVHEGWINLDLPYFDVRNEALWKYTLGQNKFELVLMEHVLEHLTEAEVVCSFENMTKYMKVGGNIRIAVPDKNHPNPVYIEYAKPGGWGKGSDDHKSFWNIKMFSDLAEKFNLKIYPIEYYDENGTLFTNTLTDEYGRIARSVRRIEQHEVSDYSSLIVDFGK